MRFDQGTSRLLARSNGRACDRSRQGRNKAVRLAALTRSYEATPAPRSGTITASATPSLIGSACADATLPPAIDMDVLAGDHVGGRPDPEQHGIGESGGPG